MKQIIAASILSAFMISNVANAAKKKSKKKSAAPAAQLQPYGMAGCGVGSLIFSKNNAFMQTLASTTNNFYLTQTFSISSGTSNCNPTGMSYAVAKQETFLRNNLAGIAKDSARGSGVFLVDYAATFGCLEKDNAKFFQTMQKNYQTIFGQAGSVKILKATHKIVSQNTALKNSCVFVPSTDMEVNYEQASL
jgi:hypothetical protein